MGLNESLEKFLVFLKNKGKATNTILAYKKDITYLIDFLAKKGKKDIEEVITEDLKAFISRITPNFTPKTVSRKINAIKTFYRFLLAENIIKENYAAAINHPKLEEKTPRFLTKIEYRALRDACRQDLRIAAIVEILLQTGLRIGELANLTIEDIKNNSLYIRAYENNPAREIPLNKAAKIALEQYLKIRPQSSEKKIFLTKSGKPFLVRNIRNSINRYFRNAGINDACVNDLRHTFIYHQLAAGAPLSLISKIVGHKKIISTKRYLDLVKGQIKEKTKLEEL